MDNKRLYTTATVVREGRMRFTEESLSVRHDCIIAADT
jgi:hypothetical protein